MAQLKTVRPEANPRAYKAVLSSMYCSSAGIEMVFWLSLRAGSLMLALVADRGIMF